MRLCVSRRRLQDGVGDVRSGRASSAGESSGVIGLRGLRVTNSSMGVSMSAYARAVCALPSAVAASPRARAALVSPASATHALVSPLHSNSWSGTGSLQGPREEEEGQRWGFRSGRRFAPCLRGG